MLIVSTTGATNINDDHEGKDGVFDVPAELGEQLLAFPGWRYPTEQEAVDFDAADTPKRAARSRKS